MNVNRTISIYAGADTDYSGRNGAGNASGRKKPGNTIQGSFLKGQFDPIEQRRAAAKKQALKIVSTTFASDIKTDNELVEHASRLKEYLKAYSEADGKIKEIDKKKEELRQEYGVSEDSQEQKDLEILEKYNQRKRGMFKPGMSQEEIERADELVKQGYEKGYTEYQQRALEWDSYKDIPKLERQDALKGIYEEAGTISAVKLERLKYHAMVDSQKEAEDILESASDEIIGMLIDEAKDHIDEKNEEELEKVKEQKEEKKEELEKLEEAKEYREEMEALADPEKAEKKVERRSEDSEVLLGDLLTENLLQMDGIKNNIQQEVADIAMKMKLVAEDVKGIKVDELI